jgi:hypothetical protein
VDDQVRWAHLLADAAADHASQPRRICELCVDHLGITGAGISMVTSVGNRGVVCATDDVSARIEDLQFTLGEGPCIDAVGAGEAVLVPDLHEPDDLVIERWPGFLEGALKAGVRAVFALPLRIGAIGVGAIDFYRDSPGDLDRGQLASALTAADAAAVALLRLDSGSPLAEEFTGDPGSRSSYRLEVHQATGMISVQAGVSIDTAFLLLRARAFAAERPIADVARDVVERRLRFPAVER